MSRSRLPPVSVFANPYDLDSVQQSPLSPSSGSEGKINAGAFFRRSGAPAGGNEAFSRPLRTYQDNDDDPGPVPATPTGRLNLGTQALPPVVLNSPSSAGSLSPPPPLSRNESGAGLSLRNPNAVASPAATAGHSPAFPASSQLGHHSASSPAFEGSASPPQRDSSASPAVNPDNDEDLMLSLSAGQASVDVGVEGFQVLSWEEVEDVKKELSILTNRLGALTARSQREQKILTAARTLERLHVNHKRMSKQTMEELNVAEKRTAAAEKDMWAVMARESALRRRLNEHYSAALAWESRRLQQLTSSLDRPSLLSMEAKGKERETELSLEIERLSRQVRELEGLADEAGVREADLRGEMWTLKGDLELERKQSRDERSQLEEQVRELQRNLQSQDTARQQQRSTDRDAVDTVRTLLIPLLALSPAPPPPDDIPVDSLAELVLDQYESLKTQVRDSKVELRTVREGFEDELTRVTKDRERLRVVGAEQEKAWMEERTELKAQLSNLIVQKQSRSLEPSSAEHEATIAQLETLWAILPARTATGLSPSISLASHRQNLSTSSSRTPPTPSPSEVDFPNLVTAYATGNGTATPYLGLQAFSDRVRGLVEDSCVLLDRAAKYARERDTHKKNSERAQRLVQESRAGLETYQRQVRALEERLQTEGKADESLDQFNELEGTIATLREDKRRLEVSISQQLEAIDELSEANEALSTRALSLSEDAAEEKRAMQRRLEDEIERVKGELVKARDELTEQRTREQGQSLALLESLNSLQDENSRLRAQIRLGKY